MVPPYLSLGFERIQPELFISKDFGIFYKNPQTSHFRLFGGFYPQI